MSDVAHGPLVFVPLDDVLPLELTVFSFPPSWVSHLKFACDSLLSNKKKKYYCKNFEHLNIFET